MSAAKTPNHDVLDLLGETKDASSSSDESVCDEKDAAQPSEENMPRIPTEQYEVQHPTTFSRGLVITSKDATDQSTARAIYYAEVSQFTLKKPDVTLHSLPSNAISEVEVDKVAAAGETSPVVGIAYGPRTSHDMKLGIGSSESEHTMLWIDLVNPNKRYHGEFTFTYNGTQYAWQRTRDAALGVEGTGRHLRRTKDSFQLLDLPNNTMVAVFVQKLKMGDYKSRGNLRIFKDLDDVDSKGQEVRNRKETGNFRVLVLLSLSIILEKSRRRKNARRTPKTAGGGP